MQPHGIFLSSKVSIALYWTKNSTGPKVSSSKYLPCFFFKMSSSDSTVVQRNNVLVQHSNYSKRAFNCSTQRGFTEDLVWGNMVSHFIKKKEKKETNHYMLSTLLDLNLFHIFILCSWYSSLNQKFQFSSVKHKI